MNLFDNTTAAPADLTEESLERMLIELRRQAGPLKLAVNYCCVTRFEIVGPYCPVYQPDPRYIHTIYPTDLDERQQWITLLLTEWPPGTFPPHPGDV